MPTPADNSATVQARDSLMQPWEKRQNVRPRQAQNFVLPGKEKEEVGMGKLKLEDPWEGS